MIDIDTLKKQPKYARMSKSSLRKVAAYQQLCQDAIALFGLPSKQYPMAKLVKMYQAGLVNREKQAKVKKARDDQKIKEGRAIVRAQRKELRDSFKPCKNNQATKGGVRRKGVSVRFVARSSGRVYNVPVKSILSALCHGKEVKVVHTVKPTRTRSPWSNLYYNKLFW